jgi:hypothetical protein
MERRAYQSGTCHQSGQGNRHKPKKTLIK